MTTDPAIRCHVCSDPFDALAACATCGKPTCERCLRELMKGKPCPLGKPAKRQSSVETLVLTGKLARLMDLELSTFN